MRDVDLFAGLRAELQHHSRMLTDPAYRASVFAEWRRQERERQQAIRRRALQRWRVRPSPRRRTFAPVTTGGRT